MTASMELRKENCNLYEEGPDQKLLRSYMPCNVTNMNTTQCIPEGEMRDNKFDCKNRADEEPLCDWLCQLLIPPA